MKITINDLFTLGEKKYITLDSIFYEGENYIFVNELTKDEEPTEIFNVYHVVEEGCVLIDDKKILDLLLPIFSNNVQKLVDIYQNRETFNIE